MAASPEFKIYDSAGTYQAACKEIEAAAALVSFYGEGATIRHGHKLVAWTEGVDGAAAESYDATRNHIADRLYRAYQQPKDRDYGETLWHPVA